MIFFLVLLYARFIGPKGIKTNEISYKVKDIDASYNGLKIIHFSDLHYNSDEKQLDMLVDEINKNKPDIVLFTGDLIDSSVVLSSKDVNYLIKKLSEIDSSYGNYSIIGDSEYLKTDTLKNIYIQSNFITRIIKIYL